MVASEGQILNEKKFKLQKSDTYHAIINSSCVMSHCCPYQLKMRFFSGREAHTSVSTTINAKSKLPIQP